MAIERDGKIYRNLQEQVLKNKEDIKALQDTPIDILTEDRVNELIDAAAIKKDGSNTPTNDIPWNDKGIMGLGFVEMNGKAAKPSTGTDIWKDITSHIHVTNNLVTDSGVDCNNNPITNVGTPTNTNDAATKSYVDGTVAANNEALEGAIALKADKTALETLSGIVEGHTTAISEINGELDTKASAQSVTDLTTTVNGKADKATTLAGYGITDALPSSTKYAGSSIAGGSADYAYYVNITRPLKLFDTVAKLASATEAVYFYGSDGLKNGAPANYVIINAKKGSGQRTILDCYALQTGYHYINGNMTADNSATWTGWILQPNNDTVGFTNKALTYDSGIYSTGQLQNEFSGNVNYNQSARTIQYTTTTTVQFIADVNGDNYITLNISGSLNLSTTGVVHGFISGTKDGGGYVVNNVVGTYTSGNTSTVTLYMPTGDTIANGSISITLFLGG